MVVSTELRAGAIVAGYRIESVAGRGGMSVVYRAHDGRLGRRVALKLMAPLIGDDERFRERFLRESRLAASIDHPNVIPIYEAGEADGLLYIAMRLVSGTDLRALLASEGPLEPARAIAIVGQVASALDAAHARGLLHLDVKPGNILLATDEVTGDHVYLSDFGLAVPGGGEGALEGGRFVGTAEYVAPEQIEGRPEERSDVYSLGCVLFECLTGRPPFGRRRMLETLYCHLNEDPPRLSDRCNALPPAADRELAAALAKDPAERPDTCGELAAGARTALGLDRSPLRPRGRLTGVLALGVLAAAAVVAALVVALRDQAAGSEAPAGEIVTFAGTGTRGSTGDGGPATRAELADPASLALDPAGNLYVGESSGYLRKIDRAGVITTVASTRGNALDFAFDSAGALYLLDAHYPALQRIGRDGSVTALAGSGNVGYLEDAPRTTSPDLCGSAWGPALDPDGRIYISCYNAHRVIRVEGDGVYTTVAGSGTAGYSGDGGPATEAELNNPAGIAIDADGNLFIADSVNHRVRRVDPDGVITTVAGTGRASLSGDGWRASATDLWGPTAVEVDREGNLYIVEMATHRVRKVDRHGMITTVAGTGKPGYSGDGGSGPDANLFDPTDVAVGADGSIYISDRSNQRIRRVTP